MTVRRATSADIPELVRLRRAFHLEDGSRDELGAEFDAECEAFLHAFLPTVRWAILVADEDGAITAHVYVALVDKVPRPANASRRGGTSPTSTRGPTGEGREWGARCSRR